MIKRGRVDQLKMTGRSGPTFVKGFGTMEGVP